MVFHCVFSLQLISARILVQEFKLCVDKSVSQSVTFFMNTDQHTLRLCKRDLLFSKATNQRETISIFYFFKYNKLQLNKITCYHCQSGLSPNTKIANVLHFIVNIIHIFILNIFLSQNADILRTHTLFEFFLPHHRINFRVLRENILLANFLEPRF